MESPIATIAQNSLDVLLMRFVSQNHVRFFWSRSGSASHSVITGHTRAEVASRGEKLKEPGTANILFLAAAPGANHRLNITPQRIGGRCHHSC
jgi:hypothetical protein